MTRKDYVALARAFRDELEYIEEGTGSSNPAQRAVISRLVQRVSSVLAADNPRFDAERFERAAYADHWDQ
jgi:hypothetical protein